MVYIGVHWTTQKILISLGSFGLMGMVSFDNANIVRKIDIFGVLSLTSYPMHENYYMCFLFKCLISGIVLIKLYST